MLFVGAETPFTFEQAYHLPGRFRTMVRCEVKGQKWELIQIVNDSVARQFINGRAIPLTDAALKELQLASIVNEISQLTPLLSEKKYNVKLEKNMKGMDTATLLVQTKGYPEIRLGFDRKSGHLVRCAYKGVDPDTSRDVELETIFEDFKTFSGLTRPMRSVVSREGKRVIELQVEKYTPLEKVDPKAFTIDE
jgi:hypothetical protein